jgi:thymidylate kinase
MKKSYLICFTGVDGSGKTTHAKSLGKYLETKGYTCKYVWGASRPFLSYFFLVFTRLCGYWNETREGAYTDPLHFAPERVANRLGRMWRLCLFIDFQAKTFLRVRLPMILGSCVICDRYFYDLLMDLQVTKISSKRFSAAMSKTLPRPKITFLMDAPEDLTWQRRGFAHHEIQAKREAFMQLAELFNFVIIDSSGDFAENQHVIRTMASAKIGFHYV